MEVERLTQIVEHQLGMLSPEPLIQSDILRELVADSVSRLSSCIREIGKKDYGAVGEVEFSPNHSDQWAMFLYALSHCSHRAGHEHVAAAVYRLNKCLHAIDLHFAVGLPAVFLLGHPVGTVLGRARYGNYFSVTQGCTVGSSLTGVYPRLGDGVALFTGSSVLGDCEIGHNVWISAGTIIMNENVPPDQIVFGSSPSLVLKPARRSVRAWFTAASGQPLS